MLQSEYTARYAFVGVGSHALQNLYPVLHYLGIQLKYICCRSPEKLSLIERRFGVAATTSLDIILQDSDVKGVFVCTSPQYHYEICTRVISSGKYLFIEKPPCRTLQHLDRLIEADDGERVMVGMQKRYSPLVKNLERAVVKITGNKLHPIVSYRVVSGRRTTDGSVHSSCGSGNLPVWSRSRNINTAN